MSFCSGGGKPWSRPGRPGGPTTLTGRRCSWWSATETETETSKSSQRRPKTSPKKWTCRKTRVSAEALWCAAFRRLEFMSFERMSYYQVSWNKATKTHTRCQGRFAILLLTHCNPLQWLVEANITRGSFSLQCCLNLTWLCLLKILHCITALQLLLQILICIPAYEHLKK